MTLSGRHVARLLTAAALAAGAGGCGVHAQRRATATDVCVGALPVTRSLLGPQATLLHLRRLSARDVDDLRGAARPAAGGHADAAPPPSATEPAAGAPALCAVAYRGTFDAARLPAQVHPQGGTGPVIVLLVTLRHPRIVQAQVRQDVPRQLAH